MKKIELGEKIEVGWNYYLKYTIKILLRKYPLDNIAILS
jgi:hypothetical protein